MISQDSIDGLKARLDIVDVVGNYVELKKAWANYKWLCPFHDENNPSFTVSAQKQFYHCFGCQAHGDAIRFVMEYEKLSYPEAIEKLAEQYNFALNYTRGQPGLKRSTLLEKLDGWYRTLLDKTPTAMEYLHGRGVFSSSIERFGIGYAPTSPMTLQYIKQNQFAMTEAVELGVAGVAEGREFARFIERITFPIHAANGTLVGFGGRTITGHPAKYVNSPQTRLFNKSRLLYAYHLAKESVHKRKQIIVTEGYLDVIMLHQAGFTHAVATLGTALTADHLPLLRKGEPRILLAYDGDKAGRAAAHKAAVLLSAAGFDGGIILFENGMDPADMVKERRIEALETMFHAPRPLIDFVLDELIAAHDLSIPKAKEAALSAAQGYLKTLSPLLQEEYRPLLAAKIGISPALIHTQGRRIDVRPAPVSEHRDIWELSFIKTLMEHPDYIDPLMDYIAPTMLQFHAPEFHLLLQGALDDPRLAAITLDDSIPILHGSEAVRAELAPFLRKHYERERQRIMHDPTIPTDKKIFLNRKMLGKITLLKQGKLVNLE